MSTVRSHKQKRNMSYVIDLGNLLFFYYIEDRPIVFLNISFAHFIESYKNKVIGILYVTK